jgi:4-amino-4-deoxy-L-arabinose transferase-like glycosyltransferase
LLLLGLCGAAAVFLATPSGLGLGGDSYYYVSGARNLIAGLGFSRPAADGGIRIITHYPPAYSAVLAVLTALGLDTLEAARWLAAGLFGANLFLLGRLVWDATRAMAAALISALLMLASPAALVPHTWVLSEPLFLFFMLLTFIFLARALHGGAWPDVVVAGIAAALGYLTRYAGAALIAAGALVLVITGRGARARRLSRSACFLGVSAIGPLAWGLRNWAATGSLTNRALDSHFPGSDRLIEALQTLTLWLLPARVPFPVRLGVTGVVAAAVVAAVVMLLVRSSKSEAANRAANTGRALGLFILVYPLFLLLSLAFVDASTPLDDRILSPSLPAVVALGALAGAEAIGSGARREWLQVGIGLAVIGFIGLTLYRGGAAVARLRTDGQGYASRAWQQSELIQWVRELPPGPAIYSNELDALYLQTGRQAFQVPIRWDPVREQPRQDYPEQLAAMRRRLQDEGAILVLFDTIAGQQAFLPTQEVLSEGLVEVYRAEDGAAYADDRLSAGG